MTYKLVSFFITSFSLLVQLSAQIEHDFVGTIQLIDQSLISYKISFVEQEDGTITGESITDFSGDHRTVSKIRGKIDRKNKRISFSEQYNLSTKSGLPDSSFCYIHIYNAKIKLKKGKRIIQGHFYSRYKNNDICIEGDLYLVGDDYFFKKMNKLSNKKIIPKKQREQIKESIVQTKKSLQTVILKKDDKLKLHIAGDSIEIRLWDNAIVDGDRVSVYQDDKLILENYMVKRAYKHLTVPIKKDSTIIKIVATNVGSRPPNTANMAIHSSTTEVPIQINLQNGNEARIALYKKSKL